MSCRRTLRSRGLPGVLLLAVVLGLAPAAVRAADDVIYPRRAGATAAPAESGAGSTRQWLTMLLGLTCAAGAGWLYWRNRAAGRGPTGRVERKLSIAESRALGNRQHLLVADYDGKKYLLGVCPGRIDLLTPLTDDKPDQP